MVSWNRWVIAAIALVCVTTAQGQTKEPTTPAAHSFHDVRYGVRFQVPAGWNFTQKDGEASTFHLDARSASRRAQFLGVASIAFNPIPQANFSSAYFYFSVTPQATAASCAAEAGLPKKGPTNELKVGGVSFIHGHDESGKICIEARDEVYTTLHQNACYRFDLVMNTFCSQDSEARNMAPAEVDSIRKRMEQILLSVTFDKK